MSSIRVAIERRCERTQDCSCGTGCSAAAAESIIWIIVQHVLPPGQGCGRARAQHPLVPALQPTTCICGPLAIFPTTHAPDLP
jgi:hypothetical protein